MNASAAAPRQSAGTPAPGSVGWREIQPAPVVLLSGPEDYIASRAYEAIRLAVRREQPGVEVVHLDAGSYHGGALLQHGSPSLFGDWKLIQVTGLSAMNDDFLQDALAYLRDPSPDVVLVLHHGGGNRGKKLLDAVKASGAPLVECQPLKKDSEKADFVTAEFRSARRRINGGALRALVAAVGSSLSDLAAACRQLMSDTSGDVTEETVENYYGGRVEATGFKVADAALAGNGGRALSMLRHALATGADPVLLVAALAVKVRTVAKVYQVRGSSAQLAKELSMAPWQVDQARRDAQRWSPAALVGCIQVLAEADAQVKGGSRDAVYAVEHAVTTIALANRG